MSFLIYFCQYGGSVVGWVIIRAFLQVTLLGYNDHVQVTIEEEEKAAFNKERKVEYTEVLVTEVTDEGKFYACNVSDGTALEKLMDDLREELTTNQPLAEK